MQHALENVPLAITVLRGVQVPMRLNVGHILALKIKSIAFLGHLFRFLFPMATILLGEIKLPGLRSLSPSSSCRIGVRQCGLGTYCVNGTVYDCPAGRYGNSLGLSSPLCSGVCRAGFYCPVGSVRSNQVMNHSFPD